MATPPQKVSILLNGTIDERSATELAAPIAQQGASVTLRRSENTRLGLLPGTCERAAKITSVQSFGASQPCYGVVPCRNGRNTAVFSRPGQGATRVISEDGTGTYGTGGLLDMEASGAQNAYVPVQIERAGAIQSVSAYSPVSTAYDALTDQLWHAYTASDPTVATTLLVYVSVTKASTGAVLGPSALVATLSSTPRNWVGLTCHGVNGARLWYIDDGKMKCAPLSLSSNIIASSGAADVYTPLNTYTAFDVVAGGDTYAYMTGTSASNVNDGTVRKIHVNSLAQSSVDYTGVVDNTGYTAVHYDTVGGQARIFAVFSTSFGSASPQVNAVVLTDSLTSSVGLVAVNNIAGDVAIKLLYEGGLPYVVVATSYFNGNFELDFDAYTLVQSFPVTGSTMTTLATLPWSILHSRGAQLSFSATEKHPLFVMARFYGSATTPFDVNYVDDPALEAWLVGSRTVMSPVARFGCVRWTVSPARVKRDAVLPSAGAVVLADNQVYVAYRKDLLDNDGRDSTQTDYPARYVVLDFNPHQPPVAHDKDGLVLVAAALPVQFDGVEVVELGGPLCAPKLRIDPDAGAGSAWAIGSYEFTALYCWEDTAGLSHRSRPAVIQVVDLDGSQAPAVYAPVPSSMRNGLTLPHVELRVYATEADGASHHLLGDPATVFAGRTFEVETLTEPDVSRQQIFSTGSLAGEALVPSAAPPAWDICVIGDRCWIIDAEVRSRALPSKRRVAGVGYEFDASLEVNFPSGAGKLMAVREFGGSALFLTETGVYRVGGDGPTDTIGNQASGSFGRPEKVSDIGCSSRASVLMTPKGLLWQRDDELVLFTGAPATVPNIVLDSPVVGALLLENQSEVAIFTEDDVKVWAYDTNRWSTWTYGSTGVMALAPSHVAQIPWDTNRAWAFALSSGGSALHRIDADESSTTSTRVWETDAIILGGDFQDAINLHWVMLSARQAGAHGVTIEVFTNDAATASGSATWTASEIATIVTRTGGDGRYTVRVQPRTTATRSVRFRVTELTPTGDGMQAVCLTVVFSIAGTVHELQFVQGSTK